jgi:hypothetical protein
MNRQTKMTCRGKLGVRENSLTASRYAILATATGTRNAFALVPLNAQVTSAARIRAPSP